MDNHPIPRQITTFEFKLIGFLTLRQFIYLALFSVSAVICFYAIPIPFLNILATVLVGSMGIALAFVTIHERGLDIWMKNLFKRLVSPSQYYYVKKNESPSFLNTSSNSPDVIAAHIQATTHLASYSQQQQEKIPPPIGILQDEPKPLMKTEVVSPVATQKGCPFFTGVVKNNKGIALPGILIYVKNIEGETLRILKTNNKGHFATFHPLPQKEYVFEIKDPSSLYLFDTIHHVIEEGGKPLEATSKELL